MLGVTRLVDGLQSRRKHVEPDQILSGVSPTFLRRLSGVSWALLRRFCDVSRAFLRPPRFNTRLRSCSALRSGRDAIVAAVYNGTMQTNRKLPAVRAVRDMEQIVLAHSWVCIVFIRTDCAASNDALPRVERMVRKFTDVHGFVFNLDDDPAAAGRYLVFDTPSIVVYLNGKPIIRQTGAVSQQEIYRAILDIHQQQDLS